MTWNCHVTLDISVNICPHAKYLLEQIFTVFGILKNTIQWNLNQNDNILFRESALHYNDVTMNTMASQITSRTIVYSTVYSGADQRKHQSSASLAFVRVIHRGPVNSPHKRPVTRKMFPFDDVIMWKYCLQSVCHFVQSPVCWHDCLLPQKATRDNNHPPVTETKTVIVNRLKQLSR